jgi:hypothetical protein
MKIPKNGRVGVFFFFVLKVDLGKREPDIAVGRNIKGDVFFMFSM